jgi:signal transduction histidine kinase
MASARHDNSHIKTRWPATMTQSELQRAYILQATWRPLALLLPLDVLVFAVLWTVTNLSGRPLPLLLLVLMLFLSTVVAYARARISRRKIVKADTALTPESLLATVSVTLQSPFDPISTHDLCADAMSCVGMARALDYGASPRFKDDPFRGTMVLYKAAPFALNLFPEAVRLRIETVAGRATLIHITRTPGAQMLVPQLGEAFKAVTAARDFLEHTLSERAAAQAALRQNEQLEKTALQARLSALQAQVEPHFLYNTLANLRHLVRTDSGRALELLDHMVDYFHVAMPGLRASASTVDRELQLASSYLSIMKTRMGARFSFEVAMAPDTAGLPAPPAMLISLVENAIKHGVEPVPGAVHVGVSARRECDTLILQVSDNGGGLAEQPGQGMGLANIHERLRLLFGEAASLVIEPAAPRGVCSSITLPISA